MGHGSDKMYITHSEHSGMLGGEHSASSSGTRAKKTNAGFQRLPYNCCALTLKPVETPVCTPEGIVFELLAIIPWLKEHGTNPVTGKALGPGELIKIQFHFNSDGNEHDPITYKIYNEHTPLVAIKGTGNVYCRETIDRLNIKPGHWFDLMTDEPFTRADLITIQDPLNVNARDLSQFDHIKKDIKPTSTTTTTEITKPKTALSSTSKPIPSLPSKTPLPYNASTTSTGRTAASFTSTAETVSTAVEFANWDEEDMMMQAVAKMGEKGRGFVRLVTNFGNLNLELYCDRAPRTCYNFLKLAQEDKYKDTVFHRLIPGFMLQGGDPTGTGRGGSSCWGTPFEDEYQLPKAHKHEERGCLSMANSGPNSNGSQFFLTFRATPHLDGKHTVFGRIVGGEDVLTKIERVPVDPATDRPLKKVILKDVAVFTNPFDIYQKKLAKQLEKEVEERAGLGLKALRKEEREKDRTTWFGGNLNKPLPSTALEIAASKSAGIGKYLAAAPAEGSKRKETSVESAPVKKQKIRKDSFGEGSGW